MEFLVGLPRTSTRHDAIWIVVDILTNSAHCLPIRSTYALDKLAQIYVKEIVCLHGIPSHIILDRDPKFNSRF